MLVPCLLQNCFIYVRFGRKALMARFYVTIFHFVCARMSHSFLRSVGFLGSFSVFPCHAMVATFPLL